MMKKSIFTYASCILAAVLFVYCSKDDPKKLDTPDANPPSISSFNPIKGNVGVSVTIDGSNFGATAAENIVKFNGTKATVTEASTTQLTVTVPAGATDGKISVEVGGQETKSTGTFTVTTESEDELSITGFAPQQGIIGTVVTITGTGFSLNKVDNIVEFNGVICTISSAAAGQLQVIVPEGATTGKISVEVGDETVQSSENFVVPPPTITSFTPEQGIAGTEVIIVGTNFSSTIAHNVVEFNGTPATITDAQTTQLTVDIPEGATTGKITVNVGGQEVESTDDFTIGPWRQLKSPPTAGFGTLQYGSMAALKDAEGNDKIYYGIGLGKLGQGQSYFDEVWVYDVEADSWGNAPTFLGVGRYKCGTFVINNKWYIIAGENGNGDVNDSWVFDPVNNSWSGLGVTSFGSDLASFVIHFGDVQAGYVYGVLENGEYSDLRSYNGSWFNLNGFTESGKGLRNAIGFTINGFGYIATGNGLNHSDNLYKYNPDSNSWVNTSSPLPGGPREGAIGLDVDNTKAYVGLGVSVGGHLDDFWEYDPDNGWTARTSFPGGGREGASAVTVNGKIYVGYGVGAGSSDEVLRGFWVYDPSLDE